MFGGAWASSFFGSPIAMGGGGFFGGVPFKATGEKGGCSPIRGAASSFLVGCPLKATGFVGRPF